MVVVRGEEEEVRRRGVEGTKAEMCILVNVETGGGGRGLRMVVRMEGVRGIEQTTR